FFRRSVLDVVEDTLVNRLLVSKPLAGSLSGRVGTRDLSLDRFDLLRAAGLVDAVAHALRQRKITVVPVRIVGGEGRRRERGEILDDIADALLVGAYAVVHGDVVVYPRFRRRARIVGGIVARVPKDRVRRRAIEQRRGMKEIRPGHA